MCGILAFLQLDENRSIPVGKLTDLIECRGPDDWGWLSHSHQNLERGRERRGLSGKIIMSHRRLSIIDLSETGWQPMLSECESLAITFNGEIYNYLELKEKLLLRGHKFVGTSDTEVILAAWKEWGPDCVRLFEGMFAFCLLDRTAGKLFAVRDPFGIKPLFYCQWDNGWAFCSTSDALRKLPGVSSRLMPQRVFDFLRRGKTDHGEDTIFQDMKQVESGTILEFDVENCCRVSSHKYWKLSRTANSQVSFDEAVKITRDLFLRSVDLHLRSDVKVGAALSGGIDSSAIVCAIRHLRPNMDLHTFTYVADDPSLSEERWADIVIEYSGAVGHKTKPTKDDFLSDISDLILAQGEPFASTTIYAQFKVFELAKRYGLKVLLDGQGADELLAGYYPYQGARLAGLVREFRLVRALNLLNSAAAIPGRTRLGLLKDTATFMVPEFLNQVSRRIVSKELSAHWLSSEWMRRNKIQFGSGRFEGEFPEEPLRSVLTYSVENLMHLLRFEDRNSMYHSIESRVPFLNKELADFLISLPAEFIISDKGVTKFVFREAMRGIVPDSILQRNDKIGFATPQANWLRCASDWISDVLSLNVNHEEVDFQEIKEIVHRFQKGTNDVDQDVVWRNLHFLQFKHSVTGQCQVT